jgi:hypothetical protein
MGDTCRVRGAVVTAVPAAARGLGAFRGCRHGDAIAYRATLEATGVNAVGAVLAALERADLCTHKMHDAATERPDYYAVLDIIDDRGCVLGDRVIPNKAAFEHLRAALNLRVSSSDCDAGCV